MTLAVTLTINLETAGEIEDEEAGSVNSLADLPAAIEAVLRKRDVAPGEWSSLVIVITDEGVDINERQPEKVEG